MGKYMIDHQNRIVHRTAYAGDECHLPETPLKDRSEVNLDTELEVLTEQKGYQKCSSCFFGSTFENHLEYNRQTRHAKHI